MRRRLQDATLIFLANASGNEDAKGFVTVPGGSLEKWDPFTGSVSAHPFEKLGEKLRAPFRLPRGRQPAPLHPIRIGIDSHPCRKRSRSGKKSAPIRR